MVGLIRWQVVSLEYAGDELRVVLPPYGCRQGALVDPSLGEILTPAPSGVMTENDPGTDCGHALNVGRKVGRV